jgi:hypothetical protein
LLPLLLDDGERPRLRLRLLLRLLERLDRDRDRLEYDRE